MPGPDRRPDVSVVIPTHDRMGLLALTLRTVFWQDEVELEVIVVDDGSSDRTTETVERLGDRRVRMVRHETPQGVSAARNRGIADAAGRWIAFLDDDDLWAPDKLAQQLRAIRETDRAWAYTGSVNVTMDHRIIGGAPPSAPKSVAEGLHRTNLIPGGGSSVVARADILREVGGFDEGLGILEDWDLWIRLAREGLPAWVRKPLVGYRVHSGNSTQRIERLLAELMVIEDRYGGPIDRLRFYRYLGLVSLRAGQRRQALRHYLRAAMLGNATYLLHDFPQEFWAVLETALPRGGIWSRLHRRRLRQPDEVVEWRAQARRWIDRMALSERSQGPAQGR
jgi:glycosyltransferase involved in cell wall biosynthesis